VLKLFNQFSKYAVVGGFAFIVDYSLLWFLTEKIKFYYLISALISFITGLVINYILSVKFVFDNRKINDKKIEFFYFSLIGVAGVIINQASMWFLTEKIKIFYMKSKLITALIVLMWNFSIRKIFLF
jgi:putative flippase GtrA